MASKTRFKSNICVRVVEEVASREDVSALDLPPLYNSVDPDVLESLIEGRADEGSRFTFSYCDYTIAVDSEGSISVEEVN